MSTSLISDNNSLTRLNNLIFYSRFKSDQYYNLFSLSLSHLPGIYQKSIRSLSGAKSAPKSGPVPPLPGQESAVSAGLDVLQEDHSMHFDEGIEDGVERGRLFVKVVGVKELDLPLPQSKLIA